MNESIQRNIRQYTMIAALLAIWLIFTVLTGGIFISPRNLSNLFLQSATIAILSIGLVLVVVSGNLDLSLGSVAGFVGAIVAVLQVNFQMDTVSSIAIALMVGALIGLWHGYWIAYRRVSALIVTLGSFMIFRGGVIGVTGGATIGPMEDSFKFLGQGFLPELLGPESEFKVTGMVLALTIVAVLVAFEVVNRSNRRAHGLKVSSVGALLGKLAALSLAAAVVFLPLGAYQGVPMAIVLVLALAAIFHFIAQDTTFGRRIFAIGGNKEAAALSGIDIKKHILVLYVMMGIMTAVAGIIFTARLNAATATAGNLFELDAIAAVVIGGSSLAGGVGTIAGALVGALVMSSLDNGMSLLDMDVTWQYVLKGLILLAAVWVDTATQKKTRF